MKKFHIILVLILFLSGCGDKENNAARPEKSSPAENKTAAVKPKETPITANAGLNEKLANILGKESPGPAEMNDLKDLIAQGAEVNIVAMEGTPLIFAVRQGDFDYVKFLVEQKKADINTGHMTGGALHEAVRHKNPDMVLYLLDHGADANSVEDEENGETPLIYAARAGVEQTAAWLLGEHGEANINFRSKYSDTTAWCEANRVSRAWADWFVSSGADSSVHCPSDPVFWEGISDPDKESSEGEEHYDEPEYHEPPMVCECKETKCSSATKDFIEKICNNPDISPEEIDKSAEEKANINAKFIAYYDGEYDEETVGLTRAVFFLRGAAWKRLIEKGADLNVKDSYGDAILIHVLKNDYDDTAETESRVKLLLDKKVSVNKSSYGVTPLSAAVETGKSKLVKLLLDAGASPDKGSVTRPLGTSSEYKTIISPLECAAMDNDIEIVKLLLAAGANVKDTDAHRLAADRAQSWNTKDEERQKQLWQIVNLIVEKGADINKSKGHLYDTLLYLAINADNVEEVKYLTERGVDAWHDARSVEEAARGSEAIKPYVYPLAEYTEDEARSNGYKPVHSAVRKRDLTEVQKILSENPQEARSVDADGNTPLHVFFHSESCLSCGDDWGIGETLFAIEKIKNEENADPIFDLLLKNGADVNAANKNGRTPLHGAAKYGKEPVKFMAALLKNSANIHAKDKYGQTPLFFADTITAAKFLITNGAEVNAASSFLKNTPLHLNAKNRNRDVVNVLLSAGADVKAKNKYGETPVDAADGGAMAVYLKYNKYNKGKLPSPDEKISGSAPIALSADSYDWESVKFLLENGALTDGVGGSGRTALFYAAKAGNKEMAQYLIERGADVNKTDGNGQTPLSAAVEYGDLELIKYLVSKGAKVKDGMLNGYLCAQKEGRALEVSKYLVENGASVNGIFERDGKSSLFCAIKYADAATAAYLVSKGADVNADNNFSCLNQAVYTDNFEMVKILVSNGADVNVINYDRTPLMNAVYGSRKPNIEIIKYLFDNGADVNLKPKYDVKYYINSSDISSAEKKNLANILKIDL